MVHMSSFFYVHRTGLLRVSCLLQQAVCEALGNAYIMLAAVLAFAANQWVVQVGPTVQQVWWLPVGIICVLVTITAVLPPPLLTEEPRDDNKGRARLGGSDACSFQRYDRSTDGDGVDCYLYEHCGY
jgi:fatty acid desaturase